MIPFSSHHGWLLGASILSQRGMWESERVSERERERHSRSEAEVRNDDILEKGP